MFFQLGMSRSLPSTASERFNSPFWRSESAVALSEPHTRQSAPEVVQTVSISRF